ncbi:MAG: hypothetical protein PHS93_03790 [Candidatus Omnitrophica bacterium]|nr:hypothetical protein [Candidatus Omnitrophota bacterium]MDD5352274.1 hypothetical protein [Candidatus Omnitrophota bacterium]MDD5549873.1 hypothetical protein [Candidatus Omnitrophota bacterium]
MATVLETLRRKALRGIITDIETNGDISVIHAKAFKEGSTASCELPKEEVERLNLKAGDMVNIYPLDQDNYLIVSTPK